MAQDILVTVFRDDAAPGPLPLLVISHGRAADAEGRATLKRARYPEAVQWFAGLGFVVAVPTRVGYGDTGGPDVEDSGDCNAKRYGPAVKAGVQQKLVVIGQLRQSGHVLPDRTVIVGQSMGGFITVGLAASNLPGIQAAVSFAGGGGGSPRTRPADPCGPYQLRQFFKDSGETARTPSLWIYAENDRYWGAQLPRQWAEAYQAGGGVLEFTQVAPHGEDGHSFFSRGASRWQPIVRDFLSRHGFPDLAESVPK